MDIRELTIASAASAGGKAPSEMRRALEEEIELHGEEGTERHRAEPKSQTPLCQADFERMLKES